MKAYAVRASYQWGNGLWIVCAHNTVEASNLVMKHEEWDNQFEIDSVTKMPYLKVDHDKIAVPYVFESEVNYVG